MSDHTLRPIWTPADAVHTARDACQHVPYLGVAADFGSNDTQPLPPPAHGRTSTSKPCPSCWAWEGEQCEPGCIQQMTPEAAQRHRAEVLDRTLAELGLLDDDHRPGMRPRRAKRITRAIVASAVVVLVLALCAMWAAQRAEAEPAGQCVDQIWLIPFQATRRTICDGPIHPDGSWTRLREFYTPEHDVPLRTYCSSGSYSSSCTTSGGYWQPRTSLGIEAYRVTPDTILADEPGHIGLTGLVA